MNSVTEGLDFYHLQQENDFLRRIRLPSHKNHLEKKHFMPGFKVVIMFRITMVCLGQPQQLPLGSVHPCSLRCVPGMRSGKLQRKRSLVRPPHLSLPAWAYPLGRHGCRMAGGEQSLEEKVHWNLLPGLVDRAAVNGLALAQGKRLREARTTSSGSTAAG